MTAHTFAPAELEVPAHEVVHHGHRLSVGGHTLDGRRCTACGFFVPDGASWVGDCPGAAAAGNEVVVLDEVVVRPRHAGAG